jgi:hypothetical protein
MDDVPARFFLGPAVPAGGWHAGLLAQGKRHRAEGHHHDCERGHDVRVQVPVGTLARSLEAAAVLPAGATARLAAVRAAWRRGRFDRHGHANAVGAGALHRCNACRGVFRGDPGHCDRCVSHRDRADHRTGRAGGDLCAGLSNRTDRGGGFRPHSCRSPVVAAGLPIAGGGHDHPHSAATAGGWRWSHWCSSCCSRSRNRPPLAV